MRFSVKVVLFLSVALLLMVIIDQYYNNGDLGLLLIIVLGSLPALTFCEREEKALPQKRGFSSSYSNYINESSAWSHLLWNDDVVSNRNCGEPP
jgi:hypothetical protein